MGSKHIAQSGCLGSSGSSGSLEGSNLSTGTGFVEGRVGRNFEKYSSEYSWFFLGIVRIFEVRSGKKNQFICLHLGHVKCAPALAQVSKHVG
jgi:hypothetical protein